MEIAIPPTLLERAGRWRELKRWDRRELGQDLRRLGMSYGEIRQIVPVSKGTLSIWCRDIHLTEEQLACLAERSARAPGRARTGAILRARNLERIEAIRAKARAEALELAADPFWLAGLVAYWAEGSKRENSLCFSNSDPGLVKLFLRWVHLFLDVSLNSCTIQLHLHSGQRETERRLFWSEVTGIPMSQFRKSFVKPEGTGHRKNLLYNGTASIRVCRSTDLFHRVMGWIESLDSSDLSLDTLGRWGR